MSFSCIFNLDWGYTEALAGTEIKKRVEVLPVLTGEDSCGYYDLFGVGDCVFSVYLSKC